MSNTTVENEGAPKEPECLDSSETLEDIKLELSKSSEIGDDSADAAAEKKDNEKENATKSTENATTKNTENTMAKSTENTTAKSTENTTAKSTENMTAKSTENTTVKSTQNTTAKNPENTTKNTDTTVTNLNRPAYIPPHLMGRSLNNPAEDMIGSGRRVQKPRLGVKVPYRNLTSQIVSQDEIAQEILERSLRKYSYADVPEGGDVFFAMKLSHRLSNKISTDGPEKKTENQKVAKIMEITKAASEAAKTKDAIAANTSTEVYILPELSKKKEETMRNSKAEELYAEISSSIAEDCKVKPLKLSTLVPATPASVATLTPLTPVPPLVDSDSSTVSQLKTATPKVVNGSMLPKAETELDNDTLLAILEGTTDLGDVSLSATSTPKPDVSNKRKNKRMRPQLDPSVERELALKQLMDFETKRNRNKLRGIVKPLESDEPTTTTTTPITVSQQNGTVPETSNAETQPLATEKEDSPKGEAAAAEKKAKRSVYPHTSAPKRFPKKYQRIIKRQLRSSKLKGKNVPSPEQQKKLPEVPEVKIAIDRYFKTYASKRKLKPDSTTPEKPPEKKSKGRPTDDNGATNDEAANDEQTQLVEADENRNEVSAADQEAKRNASSSGAKPKMNSKVMREINRLLGDEGAINMIYSIEQKRLPEGKRDANILPSLRRKKKDLLLKTKLVKNAVLRLSMSSHNNSGRVRRTSPELSAEISGSSPLRKVSMESTESIRSEPSPKVRKVAAEASKIIRRHSSSSCYSSDEEDKEGPPAAKTKDSEAPAEGIPPSSGGTSRRASSVKESKTNESEVAPKTLPAGNDEKQTNAKETGTAAKGKSAKSSRRESKESVACEPKNQTDVVTNGANAEIPEQISLNEITVRKYDNLVQIILISSSTKMKNALNAQILHEFVNVLRELEKDEKCRTVLVTSTGSSFCQGIDLQKLLCSDKAERTKIVNEFINTLTNFTKGISQFSKLLIAGVHGSAVGLGVTMLPFFDMVFASDKATFYTPYAKLGQIPEAAATLTLPHLLGNAVTSELLFGCRMLTASEALQFGLVTRILWPDKFNEELLPLARGIASHSSQSMKATKLLLRQGMNSKLDEQLEKEAKLLREHWCSEECQNRFKEYLDQEALLQPK